MEPNQPEPTISPSGTNPPPPPGVDPRSFVLPNTAIHDPLNAQRASAGVLAAQEQSATLPKAPPPPPLPFEPPPTDSVRPLETYQSDVERYVREQNVSSVTVAAAEEKRRRKEGQPIEVAPQAPKGKSITLQIIALVGGLVLLLAAVGSILFAYIRSQPYEAPQPIVAPFIAVDSSVDIRLKTGDTRKEIMNTLVTTKNNVRLSVGLIAQLQLWISTSSVASPLPAQTFFSVFTPNIPPQLLRTVQLPFMVGIHSFDTNQPFLVFGVDSYQGGFAGMLEWEKTMRQDLSPYFDYTPTKINPTQGVLPSADASSTQILTTPFVDAIVENHDARVIKNANGDIILLWTFLDNSVVLVTTNPNTVNEIITRLKNTPHMTVPGQ